MTADFRGDSAAASLKPRPDSPIGLPVTSFPRRFRRGLIEAMPTSLSQPTAIAISAAIPPRPH